MANKLSNFQKQKIEDVLFTLRSGLRADGTGWGRNPKVSLRACIEVLLDALMDDSAAS